MVPARSCTSSSTAKWCKAAVDVFYNAKLPTACTIIENWNCVQACPGNNNLFYQVRTASGSISCRGSTGRSCMSWYDARSCDVVRNVSISATYDTVGLICSNPTAGTAPSWCSIGNNILNIPGGKQPVCSKAIPPSPIPSYKCVQDCVNLLFYIVAASEDQNSVYCRGYRGELACSVYETSLECEAARNSNEDALFLRIEETCDSTSKSSWCKEAINQTIKGLPQTSCGTTPDPPVNSSWTCIQSCTDQGKFVAAQSVVIPGGQQIECLGNSPNCNWYASLSECSAAIPASGGSVAATCSSVNTGGWCQEAYQQLVLRMAQTVCPSISWSCIQSCGNSAPNFVAVAVGTQNQNIICYGPTGTQCYWFGTADQCAAAINGLPQTLRVRTLDASLNAAALLAGQDLQRGLQPRITDLVIRGSSVGATDQGYQMCTAYPVNSWCWEGQRQLIGKQVQTQCQNNDGGWTCIQSCQDGKRWVQARSITVSKKRWDSNHAIQCAGSGNTCQWFDSKDQCQSQLGQVGAGRVCDQYVSDWCKEVRFIYESTNVAKGALQFWNHWGQSQC
jgi:hypothetical protein